MCLGLKTPASWKFGASQAGDLNEHMFQDVSVLLILVGKAGCIAGKPLSLEGFKERFWKPYLLSKDDYQERCKLEMQHEAPAQAAAVGGDAVQGI